MASIINTSTTLGGIATEGDSSNELKIQTDGTDAISIDGSQVVTFTAPIVFPAGTVSAPVITTTGDTNTGIYFPAADTIGFVCGGTEDFRVDGDGQLWNTVNSQVGTDYTTLYKGYLCRAWVNFNGTGTVAIRASGNVSSITDNGTGDYTINFTTAMPDSNYCVSNYSASNSSNWFLGRVVSYSTTAYRFVTVDNAGSLSDTVFGNVAIFR